MKFILYFRNKIYIYLIIFIIIFLEVPIKSDNFLCNITHPILKNGKCDSIYCSEEEFNSSKCTINNEIVKTQWLTSFVPISGLNFSHINPVTSKDNDLIIQTTKSTGSPERKFFGITKNGRFYFKNSNDEECPYFSINATDGEDTELNMFQSYGAIIKIENDESDYFINVGGYINSYTELINFKNNTISRIFTKNFYYYSVFSEMVLFLK